MKINWTVRMKNKVFWIAIIPAILVLIKAVANVFGFTLELSTIENNLIDVVEAVFMVLGIIGIVADPTTSGISDSVQALTYDKPKE